MAITTIIFDLDETLTYEEQSVNETFLVTCALAEERYDLEAAALAQTIRSEARTLWRTVCPVRPYCADIGISSWEGLSGEFSGEDRNLKALRAWVPAYRREAWTRTLSEHGVDDDDLVEELTGVFIEERGKRHIVFPETEWVLQAFRSSYRLGIITNGAPDVQREKLNIPDLGRYFEVVVVSGEFGAGKPNPRIFTHTLEQFGVAPEATAMVGDNPINDIMGAQQVGMTGIWLNRSGEACADGVTPDAEISSLSELPGVLG